MSQEGASLPQEVEGSHDQPTAPHGSIPAGVGSPTATVMPDGSDLSSVGNLATAVDNNTGSSEHASPAVLSAGEDNNAASSKIASPAVLHAVEDSNTASSKIASPAVLHAVKDNNAAPEITCPVVLLAGEEKGNNAAGSKLASPATMLHDCDDNKAVSHAVDNNAAQSKLAIPVVFHAGDGDNGGSKITSPAMPQTFADNTTGSKLNSPVALHAGQHNNAGFKVPKPVVLHASKDMDNNAGWPKFASPVLLHAAEDNRERTKLAIQAVSHAAGNTGSSRLTRSAAAALHATKDNASKFAIQVVPHPHYDGKDNNAGLSKAARPAAVDAGESNAKEGKNNIAGEQRAHEAADVGSGSRKSNAIAAEDANHDLHIFTERERRKKMKNMFSTLHGLLPQLPYKADKATIVGEAVIYIKTLERQIQNLEKLMERKRALAAQQPGQQQLVVGAGSSSRTSSARHPAPAQPAPPPAAASSSREVYLADMVHSLQAQQAAVDAVNMALVTATAAVAGAGGSSSSAAAQLPAGTMLFTAPTAGFQTWTGPNVVVSVANNEAYINLHCPRHPGTLTKALFVLERNHIEVITTTICTQDGFRMYGIHARANPAPASAQFLENLCAEDRFKLAVSEMVQLINL